MPIRTQLPQDREQVQQLAQAFLAFGPYPQIIMALFDQAGHQYASYGVIGEVELLVATGEDETCNGFVALEWSGPTLKIHAIAVQPALRRAGVARMLLEHAEAKARERGTITSLDGITAETENPAALQFFINAGFENLGFAGYYPAGQRAVRLGKRIG
jgi:ribosomal protein S18 acetylase RimI-like enzyme